eukprot:COSAG02_NODE_8246_length_2643_cov_7.363601_1_plen_41_part_10
MLRPETGGVALRHRSCGGGNDVIVAHPGPQNAGQRKHVAIY